MRRTALLLALASICGLSGCLSEFSVEATPASSPRFLPEQFFAGATHGEGVLATRGRADRPFQVTSTGHAGSDGSFVVEQKIAYAEGKLEQRSFSIRRTGEGEYAGSLTGASGAVTARAEGNTFHLRYTITKPVLTMEQWIYLQPDGRTVLNRATVRLLGIPVAHVSERITRE